MTGQTFFARRWLSVEPPSASSDRFLRGTSVQYAKIDRAACPNGIRSAPHPSSDHGILSRLEDSVSIFLILIVDWTITDRVSLETGRGLGTTQGPGLNLNYRLSDTWSFGLGGRCESLRFRLDDRGSAPDGLCEDRSVPVYLSATYSRGRDLQVSAVAGVELNGELCLDDSQGRRLVRDNYETAPFRGATFNIRFLG